MSRIIVAAVAAGVVLSGCVARAAYDVVTLPVRAGGKVVDWSTTSRDEADRNRGRAIRKQEKREAEQARQEEKRRREWERRQRRDRDAG